jgi:hypothetical protein
MTDNIWQIPLTLTLGAIIIVVIYISWKAILFLYVVLWVFKAFK